MPTITTVDPVWETGVTNDAAELRRAESTAFLGDGSNNGVRGGIVRHGDNSLAVSINGSDQVTVQAGAAVIPAATGLGVYRVSLSAATSATAIDSRNATNPRIDLVVFRSTGAVDIITGTPGASPSAPALPAQSVELARINVPAVGGGAATVSNAFRAYATALGGILYVESSARLPGSGNTKGQPAVALDTGLAFTWSGTAWVSDTPRRATVAGTTDAGGFFAVTYAQPFPAGVTPVVVAAMGDDFGFSLRVVASSVTNTGFSVLVRTDTNAVWASSPVRVNYIALA